MTIKQDALIEEIARQHEVIIGRNDPILILQTLNAKLMEETIGAQQQMLNEFKQEMEAISHRFEHDTKDTCERALSASLTASKKVMDSLLQDSANRTNLTIQHSVEDLLARAQAKANHSKQIAILNIVASGLTLIAASIVFFKLF